MQQFQSNTGVPPPPSAAPQVQQQRYPRPNQATHNNPAMATPFFGATPPNSVANPPIHYNAYNQRQTNIPPPSPTMQRASQGRMAQIRNNNNRKKPNGKKDIVEIE